MAKSGIIAEVSDGTVTNLLDLLSVPIVFFTVSVEGNGDWLDTGVHFRNQNRLN